MTFEAGLSIGRRKCEYRLDRCLIVKHDEFAATCGQKVVTAKWVRVAKDGIGL